jgi:hypothetical protein
MKPWVAGWNGRGCTAVGRDAHVRFVGEEPALNAVEHCRGEVSADPGDGGLKSEGRPHNEEDCNRERGPGAAPERLSECHCGQQPLGDARHRPKAAEKTGAARSAKTTPERWVGTVCASLRKAAIVLAWTALKARPSVKIRSGVKTMPSDGSPGPARLEGGPAAEGAVRQSHLKDLRQGRFHECGGRAQRRYTPHPEDRARSTEGQRYCNTGDVPCSNARGE